MTVSHPADLVGRVLAGRYRLLAPIGVGASAQVFVADDVQLRRRVAVKLLHVGLAGDPTFLRRFRAEAQAAAALNHPNVVAVYDWGEDDVPFLVTELLEGGSLREILDRGDRFSLSQVLVVGLEACRALHYAHTRGFVHRDVKPANLLFGEDRRLRVADFGLARALAEASWTEPEGVVLGTARYVSPEQAAGRAVDPKSDVYSLALVLVECATGAVPHATDTAVATLAARVDRDIDVDPGLLGPLAPVIAEAGRADPAQRCSASGLGAGLMRAASELDPPEPIPLAPPIAPRVRPSGPATVLLGDTAAPLPPSRLTDPGVDTPGERGGAEPPAGDDDAGPAIGVGVAADAGGAPGPQLPRIPAARRRFGRPRGGPVGAGRPSVARPRVARTGVAVLVVSALAVLALLGGTVLGRLLGGPATWEVGAYERRPLDEVRAEIEALDAGWQLDVREGRSDVLAPGTVIAQAPPPGEELGRGATIELTYSVGAELVRVPAVVNRPFADPAVQRLFAERMLAPARIDRHDEVVEAGRIVSIESVNELVERGETIDVVVSSGPEPRTIADLAGRPAAEARAQLSAVGLTVADAEEASRTVPEGQVIRTEPAAGEQVARGGEVTVVVSTGLPRLTVPNLSGLTGREAEDRLTGEGWRVSGIEGPSNARVVTTDPREGAVRVVGSDIRIFTEQN